MKQKNKFFFDKSELKNKISNFFKRFFFTKKVFITISLFLIVGSLICLLFISTIPRLTNNILTTKKESKISQILTSIIKESNPIKRARAEGCVSWVAVGSGTNSIATSTDGLTWVGQGTSVMTVGSGVAFNGKMWVVVGSGKNQIATSTDGLKWTGRGSVFSSAGSGVAWNGKMWVAVGSQKPFTKNNKTTIVTSTDGISWTPQTTPMLTDAHNVAWNGTLWVVSGHNILTGWSKIVTSSDGINWSDRGSVFSSTANDISWN